MIATHRIRRGRLVEIPAKWRARTVWEQTKRRRRSMRQARREKPLGYWGDKGPAPRRLSFYETVIRRDVVNGADE